MPQTIAPRDAFLRKQDKAYGGKLNALQFAPVEEMNEDRQGGRSQAEEKKRIEKKKRHQRVSVLRLKFLKQNLPLPLFFKEGLSFGSPLLFRRGIKGDLPYAIWLLVLSLSKIVPEAT